MSLTSTAVTAVQTRLPKVITPRVHGYIDYAHAGFFLALAIGCRKKNPPAAMAALATSALVLVQSLMTDYPLGAKRVLPFAAHGQMDAGLAAVSPLLPKLLGFSGTKAAKVFQANALVAGTVVGLTDFSSERAHREVLVS